MGALEPLVDLVCERLESAVRFGLPPSIWLAAGAERTQTIAPPPSALPSTPVEEPSGLRAIRRVEAGNGIERRIFQRHPVGAGNRAGEPVEVEHHVGSLLRRKPLRSARRRSRRRFRRGCRPHRKSSSAPAAGRVVAGSPERPQCVVAAAANDDVVSAVIDHDLVAEIAIEQVVPRAAAHGVDLDTRAILSLMQDAAEVHSPSRLESLMLAPEQLGTLQPEGEASNTRR